MIWFLWCATNLSQTYVQYTDRVGYFGVGWIVFFRSDGSWSSLLPYSDSEFFCGWKTKLSCFNSWLILKKNIFQCSCKFIHSFFDSYVFFCLVSSSRESVHIVLLYWTSRSSIYIATPRDQNWGYMHAFLFLYAKETGFGFGMVKWIWTPNTSISLCRIWIGLLVFI